MRKKKEEVEDEREGGKRKEKQWTGKETGRNV
jgi:hypothetical protein